MKRRVETFSPSFDDTFGMLWNPPQILPSFVRGWPYSSAPQLSQCRLAWLKFGISTQSIQSPHHHPRPDSKIVAKVLCADRQPPFPGRWKLSGKGHNSMNLTRTSGFNASPPPRPISASAAELWAVGWSWDAHCQKTLIAMLRSNLGWKSRPKSEGRVRIGRPAPMGWHQPGKRAQVSFLGWMDGWGCFAATLGFRYLQ